MSKATLKEAIDVAEQAGLKVVQITYGKHYKLLCQAPDGRTRKFPAPVSPGDRRGAKNRLAVMRRFASAAD